MKKYLFLIGASCAIFDINSGCCECMDICAENGNKTNQSSQNHKKTNPKKNIIPNTDTRKGLKTLVINKLPNKSTTDKPTSVVHKTSTTTNINTTSVTKNATVTTAEVTASDTIELLKTDIINKYDDLRILLQYFFKKKIVKILDIDIENITNKDFKDTTTLQKIKTELENKMKKDKIEIKFDDDLMPENPKDGYDGINKDNLYQLLDACYESTVYSQKFHNFGTNVYSTLNFINYITCGHDDGKFLNIFKFSSNKSDFYYGFTRSITDVGNVAYAREVWAQRDPELDCNDRIHDLYNKYCNATGENLNKSNKIKEHFKITFSDENILNKFENDSDKNTVIDFINKRALSPTERI